MITAIFKEICHLTYTVMLLFSLTIYHIYQDIKEMLPAL